MTKLSSELDARAQKALVRLIEEPDHPSLIGPHALPLDHVTILRSPMGSPTGWELSEIGKAAQKRAIAERIAALQAAAKQL